MTVASASGAATRRRAALICFVALAVIMIDQISKREPTRGRQSPTRVAFLRRTDPESYPQPGGASVAAPMANAHARGPASASAGPTPGHEHPGGVDARSAVPCDPATTDRTMMLDARHREVTGLGTPFCLCKHVGGPAGNTTTSTAGGGGVPTSEPSGQLVIGALKAADHVRCGTQDWLGRQASAAACALRVLSEPADHCSREFFIWADHGDHNCACAAPRSACNTWPGDHGTAGASSLRVAKVASTYRIVTSSSFSYGAGSVQKDDGATRGATRRPRQAAHPAGCAPPRCGCVGLHTSARPSPLPAPPPTVPFSARESPPPGAADGCTLPAGAIVHPPDPLARTAKPWELGIVRFNDDRTRNEFENYRLGDAIKAQKKGYFRHMQIHACKHFPGSIMCDFFTAQNATRDPSDRQHGLFTNSANRSELLADVVDRRKAAGALVPPDNATVMHLRLGDGLIGPSCWTDWHDCRRLFGASMYAWPGECYKWALRNVAVGSLVVIVSSIMHEEEMEQSHTRDRSCGYLKSMVEMLLANGYRVEVRLNMLVDQDVVYMGAATRFVAGGGGFSQIIQEVVGARNHRGGIRTGAVVNVVPGPLPGQCRQPQWLCGNRCDARYSYTTEAPSSSETELPG